MTTDLDSRLQLAAGSLRRSVAELPVGEPPQPGRSRVAVGVPVVVLAAFIAATMTIQSKERDLDVDATPTASIQGLIAEQVPEGLQVGWAGQQAAEAAAAVESEVSAAGGGALAATEQLDLYTYIYGAANAGYAFGTSDLVVNVWDTTELANRFNPTTAAAGLSGSTLVTVQGAEALVCDVAVCSIGAGAVSTVHWVTAAGLEVVAASRTLSAEQLLTVAQGLTIQGTTVALGALPAGLPGPLTEVAQLHDTVVAGVRSVEAFWVGYTDVSGAGRIVDVTTLSGDVDQLTALVWQLGAAQEVSVRGQQAFLAVDAAADGAIELVWQEESDVLVHVTAFGLSQADVLAFVGNLSTASESEWTAVEDLAASVQASAGAAASAGANVEADAGASAGAQVDTGTGAQANAGAQVSDSGVDAGVSAQTGLVDLGAELHADLGTEAVVGAVGSGLEQGVGALVEAGANAQAGLGAVLDPTP